LNDIQGKCSDKRNNLVLVIYFSALIGLSFYLLLSTTSFMHIFFPLFDDVNKELTLSLLIAISSAIMGASLRNLSQIIGWMGQSKLKTNYTIAEYFVRPIIAAGIAITVYFILLKFFINGGPSNVNDFGIALTGAFFGLFVNEAETIFKSLVGVYRNTPDKGIQQNIVYTIPTQKKITTMLSAVVLLLLMFLLMLIRFSPFFRELIFGTCPESKTICYPIESLFFPYLFMALIISVSPLIIVIVILSKYEDKIIKFINILPQKVDYIALAGIIISINLFVAGLIVQILFNIPLLNYDVSYNEDNKELDIYVTNYGIVPAENVIISVNSNKSNVEFLNFTTDPLINPYLSMSTQVGNALFKIDTITTTSGIIIKGNIKNMDNQTSFTTYVRSDQWVGYHHLILYLIIYTAGLFLFATILIRNIMNSKILKVLAKRSEHEREKQKDNA